MKRVISCLVLVCSSALGVMWYLKEPNTFMLKVDMPPGFKYRAAVYYVPAPGETCTVETKDNKAPVFNEWWREDYKPDSEIIIRRTRKGCPLVVYNIKLRVYATYGKDRGDFGESAAQLVFKEKLDTEKDREFFDRLGVSTFLGECGWTFRTSGSTRVLRKLLNCRDININQPSTPGGPVAVYTLDQLPGKTVRMKINLAGKESPAIGDTWIKVPNGWKRCMGDGFEDQYAFCNGNDKDFSSFIMPDGMQCSIYPGCTE
ncbi:MAG TPA: hypothetical protein DIT33_14245 [Pseudomonas sp.]|uniref:hypothetical protein n=1 Tax=Pseudomonas sp. TaxID=306 RepID=UPI000ECAF768|nr:hypothetical protein [Pseudomonas sp.]HCN64536.1 hypothetical protein [Pseudomonas sp.]